MTINFLAELDYPPATRDRLWEDNVRLLFIGACVKRRESIVLDPDAESIGFTDGGFYIGSHRCQHGDEFDGFAVELLAFSDKGETDWLAWQLIADDQRWAPVDFCPWCGLDLNSLLVLDGWK